VPSDDVDVGWFYSLLSAMAMIAQARRTSESARDGAAASALGVDTDTYHIW
jgi:hypothetical protein